MSQDNDPGSDPIIHSVGEWFKLLQDEQRKDLLMLLCAIQCALVKERDIHLETGDMDLKFSLHPDIDISSISEGN